MTPPGPQLQDIQRRSRQAALLSFGGLVIVGGSLAWSGWQLRHLDTQIDEKQKTIVQSEKAIVELNSEQHRLALEKSTLSSETQRLSQQLATARTAAGKLSATNQQLTVQAAELQQKQDTLTKAVRQAQEKLAAVEAEAAAREVEMKQKLAALRQEVAQAEEDLRKKKEELQLKQQELASYEKQYTLANQQWQQSLVVARREKSAGEVPITALVEPQASARQMAANLYDCFIWLEVPEKRRAEIRSVSYTFNHPTFSEKVMRSTDAAKKFGVGYRGWGALRLVIITLELRSGEKHELAFDMAQALGLAVRSPGSGEVSPGKEPIAKASIKEGFKPDDRTPPNLSIDDLTRDFKPPKASTPVPKS